MCVQYIAPFQGVNDSICPMATRADALKHFKKVDPHFHQATKHVHIQLPPKLDGKRTRAALFSSLVSIVVSQQLGVQAADAIFVRVQKVCGKITPETVLKASEKDLAAAGLSGAKIKTIKAIAKAVQDGSLDLLSLKSISEAEAAAKLTSIWGLGPWSAEMFMMFALGRSDVFSAGDLGLVRAIEAIFELPKGAPREQLLKIAEKWAPHRTYACLLLWRTRNAAPKALTKGRHRS